MCDDCGCGGCFLYCYFCMVGHCDVLTIFPLNASVLDQLVLLSGPSADCDECVYAYCLHTYIKLSICIMQGCSDMESTHSCSN